MNYKNSAAPDQEDLNKIPQEWRSCFKSFGLQYAVRLGKLLNQLAEASCQSAFTSLGLGSPVPMWTVVQGNTVQETKIAQIKNKRK